MVYIPFWVAATSVIGTGVGVIVLVKDHSSEERVSEDVKLHGRTAIVTGANTGIGKAISHDFAKRGGRVLMACRDLQKCEVARKEIMTATFNKNVYCKKLDLSNLQTVREFAEDVNQNEQRVDILVNNAGVMGIRPRKVTHEGFEWHLGVNHLGPFLLTNLLLDKLKSSAPSRVVITSSISQNHGGLHWDDLNWENYYDWRRAYKQSKYSQILFAKELDQRLKGSGVTTYCIIPGLVNTEFGRHLGSNTFYPSRILFAPIRWMMQNTPEQGAQCSIFCALQPGIEELSGNLFYDSKERLIDPKEKNRFEGDKSKRLWATSEKWTGLT